MKRNKKVWLVLSGSGNKLWAFLGAILAAAELGYEFTGVSASSGGAPVAGGLAKYWDPDNPEHSVRLMIEEALTLDTAKIFKKSLRLRFWEWLLTKLWRRGPRGIFDNKLLLKEFRDRAPATFGDARLPVQITAYQSNLKSPRAVLFQHPADRMPEAMMASMTLPVFDPMPYGKALLEDGGWVQNLPIPRDKGEVLAFYFGSIDHNHDDLDIVEDPAKLRKLNDNIERMESIINGLVSTNMRNAVNEAEADGVKIRLVNLRTTMSGMDFFASLDDRKQAIAEGYARAYEKLQ